MPYIWRPLYSGKTGVAPTSSWQHMTTRWRRPREPAGCECSVYPADARRVHDSLFPHLPLSQCSKSSWQRCTRDSQDVDPTRHVGSRSLHARGGGQILVLGVQLVSATLAWSCLLRGISQGLSGSLIQLVRHPVQLRLRMDGKICSPIRRDGNDHQRRGIRCWSASFLGRGFSDGLY